MQRKRAIKSFNGTYSFLSNFYPSPIIFEGRAYSTVEHAFQAAKATNDSDLERIRLAKTPTQAKAIGRSISLKEDWDESRVYVMRLAVAGKFKQSPILRTRLLETVGRELVEGNTWGDRFWGTVNGQGDNNLGKILMSVREEVAKYGA